MSDRRDFLKASAASLVALAVPFPIAAPEPATGLGSDLIDGLNDFCGSLKLYAGPMPFSPEFEPEGACLCELSLDYTEFAENGRVPALWSGFAQSTGECKFFRVLNQDGAPLLDSNEITIDGPIFMGGEVKVNTIHGGLN